MSRKRKYEGPKSGWFMYGNWWGPNWSAGSYGDSRDYEKMSKYPKPIDYNDESAMFHDQQYAIANRSGDTAFSSKRKRDADFEFAKRGIKSGTLLGAAGALAVGAQGIARTVIGAVQKKTIPPRLKQNNTIVQTNNNMGDRGRSRSRSRNKLALAALPAASRARSASMRPDIPRRSFGTQTYNTRRRAGNGKYKGKIPFPSKRPKIYKDLIANKGSRGEIEGTFKSDADRVMYVGFTSMIRHPTLSGVWPGSATYNVAAALLRMILKRECGIVVENHAQTWEMLEFGTESGGVITATRLLDIRFWATTHPDAPGTGTAVPTYSVPYTYTPAIADTFREAAIAIATNVITSASYGARGGTSRAIYGYDVSFRDQNQTAAWVVSRGPLRRLDNQYMKVYSTTKIHFQNATTSDGDSKSTDVIDTNPIKGRIYYFPTPTPIIKHIKGLAGNIDHLMIDQNGDGVLWPNTDATSATGYQVWNQLPPPDAFQNCKRWDSISLEPGDIKSYKMKFEYEGKLSKFITNLDIAAAGTNYQFDVRPDTRTLGTSVLFAFDKRLNTGDTKVTMNWERTVKTGAVMLHAKRQGCLPAATAEQTLQQDDFAA